MNARKGVPIAEEDHMAKLHVAAITASLILNLFLALNLYYQRKSGVISWTRDAAEEAEVVAATLCSGHGRAFLDGHLEEGRGHVCECYSCYYGPDCSQFSDCPADADSGHTLFLEPFWMQHEASSAVLVPALHRMAYTVEGGGSNSLTDRLKEAILRLHTVVGNANVTGRFVVIGVGSLQLINAAVRALSAPNGTHSSSPATLVATPPYYPAYRTQSEYWNGRDFRWEGDAALWKNRSNDSTMKFIELVTSPNNPDGHLMTSVLKGPFTKPIYDYAFYWPHYTAISYPADEDVMLFSLSKITGHAGSRLGWALVKDEDVYNKLYQYVDELTIGVSHDTQLRALKLLETTVAGNGREFFGFGYQKLRSRWQTITKTLANSRRFSLQKLSPRYCDYFGNVTGPSPAFGWLKCEMDEEIDCASVLKSAGILGRRGSLFGAENRYLRISLIQSQDDFDWLIVKLRQLISNEVIDVKSI